MIITAFLLVDILNTNMFLGGLFWSTQILDPDWDIELLIA